MEDRTSPEQLIFLHIPKAGGRTLHRIIERQYDIRRVYTLDGLDPHGSLRRFVELSDGERAKIHVLKGHMSFGYHVYMQQPVRYITMLREPVQRIVSHYNYVLDEPAHYLYEHVTTRRMSLTEYASSGLSTELENGQTRLIAGIPDTEPCGSQTLQQAKENIETFFAVAGITEQFDATLILLKQRFSWGDVRYIKKNVSDGSRKERLSDGVKHAIEDRNLQDLELYEYVRQRLERTVSQQGRTFHIFLDEVCGFKPSWFDVAREKFLSNPWKYREWIRYNSKKIVVQVTRALGRAVKAHEK